MIDFTTKLPEMKSGNELISALSIIPEYDKTICQQNQAVRLMALSDLYQIYIPSQMSLEIYSQLINKDITRGRKIVGTGTISEDGEVGEIDGVKYKLRGAVKNKAQIFITPSGDNYKEAVKEKKKNNYKIKIIEAKNFKQVLEELAK